MKEIIAYEMLYNTTLQLFLPLSLQKCTILNFHVKVACCALTPSIFGFFPKQ